MRKKKKRRPKIFGDFIKNYDRNEAIKKEIVFWKFISKYHWLILIIPKWTILNPDFQSKYTSELFIYKRSFVIYCYRHMVI